MTHIYSAYHLLMTCVYVHVRKGAKEILGKPVSDFQVQNYFIYFWRVLEMRVSSYLFAYVNIYLRWFAKK